MTKTMPNAAQRLSTVMINLPEADDLLAKAMKLVTESQQLIASQQRRIAELERLANHDCLTGLNNRLGLAERVSLEIAQQQRGQSAGMALMLFDLDKFKAINDSFGHLAGDAVLQNFAQFLNKQVRCTDIIARLGGDEFALVFTNVTEMQAGIASQKIIKHLTSLLFTWQGEIHAFGASYGLAYGVFGDDFNALYCRADSHLYQNKHQPVRQLG